MGLVLDVLFIKEQQRFDGAVYTKTNDCNLTQVGASISFIFRNSVHNS